MLFRTALSRLLLEIKIRDPELRDFDILLIQAVDDPCLVFILWSVLTGPLKVDLGFNFNMHPIMIGIFSHPILFISGHLASLVLGGEQPSVAGLTIWERQTAVPEVAAARP